MMEPICEVQSLAFCCGVYDVGQFSIDAEDAYYNSTPISNLPASGTGIFIATFVNTSECKQAYDQLTKSHTLLFQSPVKINKGTGRKLFLGVFMHKTRAKSKKKEGSSASWPAPMERRGEKLPAF